MTVLLDTGCELDTHELSTLESVLRVCRTELVLLDAGAPRADIQTHVVDGALLGSVTLGMRVRARFVLPSDWCLLLFLHHADPAIAWCHGMPMGSGAAVNVLPQGVAEFSLPDGARLSFALVPLARLPSGQPASPLMPAPPRVLPGVRRDAGVQQLHGQLEDQLAGGHFDPGIVERLIQCHAAASQSAVYCEGNPTLRTRRSRYLVFRKAEDFMRDNLRRQIYMQELCDAAGVSERLLRYAFEDLAGVSPSRYLSMYRLCEACRALSSADASVQSVKSVALDCGLWDLSRFADSYRRVFGELPRQTLYRSVSPAGLR